MPSDYTQKKCVLGKRRDHIVKLRVFFSLHLLSFQVLDPPPCNFDCNLFIGHLPRLLLEMQYGMRMDREFFSSYILWKIYRLLLSFVSVLSLFFYLSRQFKSYICYVVCSVHSYFVLDGFTIISNSCNMLAQLLFNNVMCTQTTNLVSLLCWYLVLIFNIMNFSFCKSRMVKHKTES